MRRPLASLVLMLLLAACGQTGPLYLPEPAAVEPAAVEPAPEGDAEPAAVEPAAVEPAAVEPAAVEPAQSTGGEQ